MRFAAVSIINDLRFVIMPDIYRREPVAAAFWEQDCLAFFGQRGII